MSRVALLAFVAAGIVASGTFGATAFNYGNGASRSVTISVVGDSAAYLKVAATAGGAFACFVPTPGADGKLSVKFDSSNTCAAGTGTGLGAGDANTGTRYALADFNDLLTVTNVGDKATTVFVNSTTSSGSGSSVKVQANATTTGTMTDGNYSTSATAFRLNVGSSEWVGIQVRSGTLAAGSGVSGTITLDASS